MTKPRTLDVSELPSGGFGPRSGPWWGTVAFMAAEGTTLALCAATYLYLSRHYETGAWPPGSVPPPDLLLPTVSAIWLLASIIPARMLARAAKRRDTVRVKWLLVASIGVEAVALGLRAFEFDALNVRWDTNSYGSILWWTLGLHTTLLAADLAETATFAAVFVRGRVEEKHYSDADDVALYWHFVALAWVPLYVLIYLSPRIF